MPLSNVDVSNFRAFQETEEFKFAPITVITGTNSSGKSSLLDAIRVLGNYLARVKNEFRGNIPKWNEEFRLSFHDYIDRIPSFKGILNNSAIEPQVSFSIDYYLKNLDVKATATLRFIQSEKSPTDGFLQEIEIALQETGEVVLCWKVYESGQSSLKVDYKFFIESVENEARRQLKFFRELARMLPDEALHPSNWSEHEHRFSALKSIHPDLYRRFREGFARDSGNDEALKKWPAIQTVPDVASIKNKDEQPSTPKNLTTGRIEFLETFASPSSTIYNYDYWTSTSLDGDILNNSVEQRLYKDGLLEQGDSFLEGLGRWEQKWLRQKFEITDDGTKPINNFGKMRDPLNNRLFTEDPKELEVQVVTSETDSDMKVFDALRIWTDFSGKLGWRLEGRSIGGIPLSEKGAFVMEDMIFPQIKHLVDSLVKVTEHSYVPSIRALPQRYFTRKQNATYIELAIQEFIVKRALQYPNVKSFLNRELRRFGIGEESKMEVVEDLGIGTLRIVRGENTVNILDLGFGILQFIPVLLRIALSIANRQHDTIGPEGIVTGGNDLILIEEPETNLHPALQSKLADLFVEASREYRIQFILESHSEYLIRKLQYLTVKAEIRPEDTQIYYIQQGAGGTNTDKMVRSINIQEDGSLSEDFGVGFFDEADKIAMSIWSMNHAQKN